MEDLLIEILKDRAGKDGPFPALEHVLANFFNEPIHRKNKEALAEVGAFVEMVYGNSAEVDGQAINVQENVYALLRLLDFTAKKVNEDEEE